MLFGRLMGIVPLGIGLTVLGFMWSQPFGAFGSPPLFFRIFASFIALAFVMVGTAALSGKGLPSNQLKQLQDQLRSQIPEQPEPEERGTVSYECPRCGAALDKEADVSPHGDVKCAHCDRWFNIHGRT